MSATLKQYAVGIVAVAVLIFTGCSQTPQTPATEPEVAKIPTGPPELMTGKVAFWPMYKSARSWNPDVVILGLMAKDVPGFTNGAGKAAMWNASFGSPSLHQYRVDSDAIAASLPDIHKGAVDGFRMPWGGVTRDGMPIDISSVTVDSDVAYQTAAADAAPWLKNNPTKKLSSFQLAKAYKFDAPVWYLMWGDKKSGYVAVVDATTGKVLKGK